MTATARITSIDAAPAQEFIAAIFEPGDIVEFRCIKVGHVKQFWSMADEVGPLMAELGELNRDGFNVYIGINPRCELEKSGDDNVLLARCVFADFDGVTEDEARRRIEAAKLPSPSFIISSGHGVHCYWILAEPTTELTIWTDFQMGLAALLGSDPVVHNPERIMRLPGTVNCKQPESPVNCWIIEREGTRYEWAEILPLIPKPQSINGNGHPPARPVSGEILDGRRNATLTSEAGTMRRRGMSEAAIEAALFVENQAKCRPPLPDDEVRRIAESVSKYPAGENGQHEADSEPLPETVSAGALCGQFKELKPIIIEGIARATEILNIIATSKAYKTFTAIYLAICVCVGRMFLGRFAVSPGAVLYIDCELHPTTFAFRLRKIASAMGVTLGEFADQLDVLSLRGKLRDLFALDPYFRSIPHGKYRIIIIDALYRIVPAGFDENSNSDVTRLYNKLNQIAEMTGAAIIVIHHASKGSQASKSVTDTGSGAGAGARAVDNHVVIRPHKVDGCSVMESAPRSFPPMEPIGLRMKWPLWEIDSTLDTDDLLESGRRTRKIDETEWTPQMFADAFIVAEPKSKSSITVAAGKRGLKAHKAALLLSAAVDDGFAHIWGTKDRRTQQRFANIPQPAPPVDVQKDRP